MKRVGLPDALHRDRAHKGVVDLLPGFALAEEAAQDRRIGRAGADYVHRDAFARDLARQRLAEGEDAAFAGRVHRFAGGADARRVGGDVDDAAVAGLQHRRQHEMMHVERAAQVDGDQLFPLAGLGIGKVLEAVPAGVVHQHVDATLAERRLCRGIVRDVEHERRAFALGGNALGRLAGAIGHQQPRAFLGETPANRSADRAAAAGDEHVFAGEALHFGRLSMTRFALPIERSTVPTRTSALMPTYDLMWCWSCAAAAVSPSTMTARWSSGPCLESSST